MRYVLTLGMLVSFITQGHAGEIVVAWDWDTTAYPGVTFVLRGASTTGAEIVMDPFTPQQCQAWPDKHVPTPPASTLCGPVCLEQGEYSLTLYAKQGSARSDESPVLDITLTTTTPCRQIAETTVPVVKPPTNPKPPPYLGPIAGGLAAGIAAGMATSQEHIEFPTSLINMKCVEWKIVGPCFCNPSTPCVTVEYWEPGWIIETVKIPGTTALDPFASLLSAAWQALGVPTGGGGGAGNASGTGHTNLQYHEAHVVEFPQVFGGPCTGCAPQPTLAVNYVSEADPAWRLVKAAPMPSLPGPARMLDPTQLGVWAPLFPRGGKSIHSSEPVGSGIAAARAMNIAFMPIGPPPQLDVHKVLKPTGAESRCCQLATPRQSACFPMGTTGMLWETGTVSPRGMYTWIIWRKRSCCVNPNQGTCGITLLGGYGENACVPQTSTP